MPKKPDFTKEENEYICNLIDALLEIKGENWHWLGNQWAYSHQLLYDNRNNKKTFTFLQLQKVAEVFEISHIFFTRSLNKGHTNFLERQLVKAHEIPFDLSDIKHYRDLAAESLDWGVLQKTIETAEEEGEKPPDFWKNPKILPFRSQNAIDFWEFQGDEIAIKGPARCGKSTLIFEYVLSLMFRYPGIRILIARAFSVDLDSVRQNIKDTVKYVFQDSLSPIEVIGGNAFHTLKIGESEMYLKGIDRSQGTLGSGYHVAVFSQAEQIKKSDIDVVTSRVTPTGEKWVVDGQAKSLIIYDLNPNRLDHWIENRITDRHNPLYCINFDFPDHPAYFDEDGNETALYKKVYSRLSRLEGVWRKRLLEGQAANPEGTVFEIEDCHILEKLPDDFYNMYQIYRAMDFGNKDPSVCLWFGVHRHTNDIICYREWRKTTTDVISMGNEVKLYSYYGTPKVDENGKPVIDTLTGEQKEDRHDETIEMTVIDPTLSFHEILRNECDIPNVEAPKGPGSIKSGISLLQYRLQLSRENKDGGIYFIDNPVGGRDPNLEKDNEPLTTIHEFDLYSWEEDRDKPIDKYNHGIDSIRYMLDYLHTQFDLDLPAILGTVDIYGRSDNE